MATSNPYVTPPPVTAHNPYEAPPSVAHAVGNVGSDETQGRIPPIVIAGFVLAFFGGILGAILCGIGLKEARRRGAGEGLAIAGIVISIITVLYTTLYWSSLFG